MNKISKNRQIWTKQFKEFNVICPAPKRYSHKELLEINSCHQIRDQFTKSKSVKTDLSIYETGFYLRPRALPKVKSTSDSEPKPLEIPSDSSKLISEALTEKVIDKKSNN